MRNSVAKLIRKFALGQARTTKELHAVKSTARKLRKEWNRCGQHQRFELRQKMEAYV